MRTANLMLQEYLSALASKNIEAIEHLTGNRSLLEIPLLKPNRLLGNAEIVKAHREIFSNLESVDIDLSSSQASDSHAIGTGELRFTRCGGGSEILPAGIVAEADATNLLRISLYCDTRNIRRWSDKTIT